CCLRVRIGGGILRGRARARTARVEERTAQVCSSRRRQRSSANVSQAACDTSQLKRYAKPTPAWSANCTRTAEEELTYETGSIQKSAMVRGSGAIAVVFRKCV